MFRDGTATENIKLTLTVEDAGDILPSIHNEDKGTSFALESWGLGKEHRQIPN